jgi:hypothetical protein
VSWQDLDRHSAIQSGVSSFVHLTHPTSTQHALNLVRAQLGADERRRLASQLLRRNLQGRPFDELCGLLAIPQQRFHFPAQLLVSLAIPFEESLSLCLPNL